MARAVRRTGFRLPAARSDHGQAPLRVIATALVTAALVSAAGVWAPSVGARPLVTGISDTSTGYTADPLFYNRIDNAGAHFVRIAGRWDLIAPPAAPVSWNPENPADPHYDWSALDASVTQATRSGLTPLVGLDGAPAWAQRCQSLPVGSYAPCDPDPSRFAEFAKAAARRYSGKFQGLPRVRYWQALNEPNLNLYFNPQFADNKPVSPQLYRNLINAFSPAVKSVSRSNVVVAAGLAPLGGGRAAVSPLRFAQLLLCMKGRQRPHPTRRGCHADFDVFDIHPYTTGGPTHKSVNPDDVQLGDLPELKRLLTAADRAGRIHGRYRHTPLWATEFSWDSNPPDPGGLKMTILARWAAEAIYRSWDAGVSHFFWWDLRDEPTGGLGYPNTVQSGLYFRGDTLAADRPKLTLLRAFRFPFVALRRGNGFFFWGRTPTSRGGAVRIEIRTKGGWHKVFTANANRSGIFSGVVSRRQGFDRRSVIGARYRGRAAVPFSLKYVKDFYQPPFG